MKIFWKLLILLLLLLGVGTTIQAQTHYRYSYVPKKVFTTQVFPITIVTDAEDTNTIPSFHFDKKNPLHPIDQVPLKDTNGGQTFYTFYFKADTGPIQTPTITIEEKNHKTLLKSRHIPVETLQVDPSIHFCGLIATSCKIVTSQVSEFDAENNLVSLTLKVTEANPEEIKTIGSIEYGIEKIQKNGSESTIEYYFVLPSSKKSITSSYYNILQNRFISKTISTDYKSKPVAAQENLNPVDSSFDKVKKYGLAFLALFFFWMFWQQKEILFLILFSLSMIVWVSLFIPHTNICVQEGASLYILPTHTSTTSGQVDREYHTEVLNKKENYYKIQYDHNIIGWIKDEDTCKD